MEYLPFGEVWIEDVDPATRHIPFRFTSKELDRETGLYYYGARYYEPKVSRWMNADPAGWGLVNPMDKDGEPVSNGWPEGFGPGPSVGMRPSYSVVEATNWYAYVSNNPVKYVDPSGGERSLPGRYSAHQSSSRKERSAAIGAAIGAILGAVIGGTIGGAGGTLALPGGGTIAGAGAGAAVGAIAGAAVGALTGVVIDKVDELLNNTMQMSSKSDGLNSNKSNNDKPSNRKTNPSKNESKVWRDLDNYRGEIKQSGSGRNRQFYKWDHTHNDIEVYNRAGEHLGSMDSTTGEMYRPPVEGRSITL